MTGYFVNGIEQGNYTILNDLPIIFNDYPQIAYPDSYKKLNSKQIRNGRRKFYNTLDDIAKKELIKNVWSARKFWREYAKRLDR